MSGLIRSTYDAPLTADLSANTTISGQDVVFCTGTIVITLESAAKRKKPLVVKNIGTGTIKVVGPGAETIDGQTQLDINVQYEAYTLQSNGTNWFIL